MQRAILIDPMGSGKSIIGRRLAEQFAARIRIAFVDLAEAVEEMAGFLSDCGDE